MYLIYSNLQIGFDSHMSSLHLAVYPRPEPVLFLLLRPHISIPDSCLCLEPSFPAVKIFLRSSCCHMEAFYSSLKPQLSLSQSSAPSFTVDREEDSGCAFLPPGEGLWPYLFVQQSIRFPDGLDAVNRHVLWWNIPTIEISYNIRTMPCVSDRYLGQMSLTKFFNMSPYVTNTSHYRKLDHVVRNSYYL